MSKKLALIRGPAEITGRLARYFRESRKPRSRRMRSDLNEAQIICLTPVRNEAWILERFLRAAELWADRIILADQGSSDESRAIASGFDKVRVIDNLSPGYDEGHRQRLLLDAAREIEGRRFLIALDADEFLTPNWRDSEEWRAALASPPGTVISFDWVNVLPDGRSAYVPNGKVPFAFVDDGSDHAGDRIHSARIPYAGSSRTLSLDQVKVLHLQLTDWPRMKSKQRWYQCWELLNFAGKRPVQIYRQYHRMDAFPVEEVHPLNLDWLERYRELGIDLAAQTSTEPLWWDREVLTWIIEHGPERFRRLDIWDVPWQQMAQEMGCSPKSHDVADPRGLLDRRILGWLATTQDRIGSVRVRWLQRMLIPFGW